MDGPAVSLPASFVSLDARRDGALEEHLHGASTLAFRVAYSVLRSRPEAEDVAQEAVVRVCRKLTSLKEPARFRPWLVRIAWRLALDHRRAQQRRERREQAAFDDGAAPASPSVEQDALAREVRQKVWDAVDALPEKLRVVIVLGAMEGHDVREVAALLGVPEGTVKSRLHLARRRLAESLRCLASPTKSC